jgi:hypothetical protein
VHVEAVQPQKERSTIAIVLHPTACGIGEERYMTLILIALAEVGVGVDIRERWPLTGIAKVDPGLPTV